MNRSMWLLACLLLALLAYALLRPHRPAAGAPPASEAEPAGIEQQPIHELRTREIGDASEYLVRNLVPGPIEVRCTLASAENIRTDPSLPRKLVVPASSERLVTELQRVDPHKIARGQVACRAWLGDPNAHPATDTVYALPFAPGTNYRLAQGFNGSFSHQDEENRYALDFGVPEGTPVLAARAGVVMQVEENFRAHGLEPRFGDRANYVRVLHDDGSMALYAHLAPASLLRRPGDRVVVGQLVGKSGNTGLSTGPHLHFAIQRNAGMSLVSIPFAMQGVDPASARD
jgi:murein DD-endopeptidase MepM/ murein hydrolase activator NlpD